MRESELRKHRCCFTGHRPEKLTISEGQLTKLLEAEIRRAIDSGHTTFISGMAKGVDIVAAEIVLHLRAQDPRLKLICALPHPGFGQHWLGGLDGGVPTRAGLGRFGADDLPRLFLCLLPGQKRVDGTPFRHGDRGVQRGAGRDKKYAGLRQKERRPLRHN